MTVTRNDVSKSAPMSPSHEKLHFPLSTLPSSESFRVNGDDPSALPSPQSMLPPLRSLRFTLKRVIAGVFITMVALSFFRPIYRSYTRAAVSNTVPRPGCNRNLATACKLSPNEMQYKLLPSGDAIPSIALGTWKASAGEVGAAVSAALRAVCDLFFVLDY